MPNEESLRDYRVIGAAGEHYVLCQLLRHGFIAAPAPEGVAKMDIIASDRNGAHLFSIQVKTRNERGTDGGWHMKKKHETALPGLFYCFVDLGPDPLAPVSCYVLPAVIVAEVIRGSHAIWARGLNMRGRPRKADTEMRRFLPNYATPTMLRPQISGCDRTWLQAHGAGWLTQYNQAWTQLGPS